MVKAFCAAYPDKRVAIVSETNAVIDEDMERLIETEGMKPGQIVRIGIARNATGGRAGVHPDRRACYLTFAIEDMQKKCRTLGVSKQLTAQNVKNEEQRLVEKSQAVVTTLAQLGKERFSRLELGLIVNDEGAQTLESSLIQALGPRAQTLVSVGDPYQLLAYSPGDEAARDFYPDDDRRHKQRWSVVHSLPHAYSQEANEPCFPGFTMDAEFRSHPRITRFLQPFYAYKIRDQAKKSDDYLRWLRLASCFRRTGWHENSLRSQTQAECVEVCDDRVLWMSPSNSASRAELERRMNFVEAVAVVELLLRLREHVKKWNDAEEAAGREKEERVQTEYDGEEHKNKEGDDKNVPYVPSITKTVLVISPYKSQFERIEKLLKPYRAAVELYLPLEIRTTDSSQGREAQITIVSMVRNRDLGFLHDYPARSLVSMSRSRDYLSLLASHETFRKDVAWKRVIENADRMKLPCLELAWTTDKAAKKTRSKMGQCRLGGIDSEAVRYASDVRDEDY